MAIQQGNPNTGYRDPMKAMSIKALQERQKAAALATAAATKAPEQIASPWQGLSHLTGVLGAQYSQNKVDTAEAEGRQRLAQLKAQIDPNKGATQQQLADIGVLDQEFADKEQERVMTELAAVRNREDQQKAAADLQAGQQTFQSGENDLNRQADAARQKLSDANAAGRQDDAQAATVELANLNAKIDAQKAADAETAKTAAIGTQADAKIAEAKKLGLVEGTPEYQKFVYDITPAAGTNITTNVGGGKKLDETLDVEEGKIWTGHQKERNVAAGSQKDMAMLGELVKQAPQGPIMGTLANMPILRGFSNAGVAFNSIVKRVAPTLRVEGSGSTSDIEYQGMLDSLPALGNYPEANALIIGMMQAKAAINIERGNTVDAYRNGEITDIQARQKLAEINSRSISNPELEALFQKVGGGGGAGGGAPADAGGGAPADAGGGGAGGAYQPPVFDPATDKEGATGEDEKGKWRVIDSKWVLVEPKAPAPAQ